MEELKEGAWRDMQGSMESEITREYDVRGGSNGVYLVFYELLMHAALQPIGFAGC